MAETTVAGWRRSLGAGVRHVAGGLRKRAFYSLWEPSYLPHGYRPGSMALNGMVTAPHQLSALTGIQIMQAGGNAVDAAAAVGLADTVLNPHQHSLGGEAVILIYLADQRRVVVVNGNTVAPRAATIEFYRGRRMTAVPGEGLLAAGVPGLVDAWITALDRFGTLSLARVARPALDLAEQGYPLSASLQDALRRRQRRFHTRWTGSGAAYLAGGEVPPVGSRLVNRDLACTLRSLITAEEDARRRGADRSGALQAARDVFYRGPVAEAIASFSAAYGGLLSREDLSSFQAPVEGSTSVDYRGYQVHKPGAWSQGLVLLQALNLLEGFDLSALAPDGGQFVHTLVEAQKLAFADREQYYGDPAFVEIPVEALLSKPYAERRRALIDPHRASLAHRPGDPRRSRAELREPAGSAGGPLPVRVGTLAEGAARGDTIHFDVSDPAGNLVAATTSGGTILYSPVIAGLGFALGTRLQMFHLDPRHPNALAPGKRPRTTLSPTLVLRDGRPCLALGSPGGDSQEQVTLQALVRLIDHGAPVQAAAEAPVFLSRHFPSSFHPHSAVPGALLLEARLPASTEWRLRRQGHRVSVRDWLDTGLLAIQVDPESGLRRAGVDPRPAILSRWEVGGLGF